MPPGDPLEPNTGYPEPEPELCSEPEPEPCSEPEPKPRSELAQQPKQEILCDLRHLPRPRLCRCAVVLYRVCLYVCQLRRFVFLQKVDCKSEQAMPR